MQKIALVAHRKDRSKILKRLTRLGTVETVKSDLPENTAYHGVGKHREEIERKLNRLTFAFQFIKDAATEVALENKLERKHAAKEGKKIDKKEQASFRSDLKRENVLIDYDELSEIVRDEYELFAVIEHLEELNSKLVDIKSERSRKLNLSAQLKDYVALDLKFSELKSTAHTLITAGLISPEKTEELRAALGEDVYFEFYPNEKSTLVFVAAYLDDAARVGEALTAADFAKCPYDYAKKPTEMLAELAEDIATLEESRKSVYREVGKAAEYNYRFKLLYEFYNLELAKSDVAADTAETGKAFYLQGWVPAPQAELTVNAVKEVAPTAIVTVSDPEEGDAVPTYLKNSKFVAPFGDGITKLYGYPKYGDLDPNPFVALFYFVFFGFMLGDAGYGILMTIACFLYLAIKKPVKNSATMIWMFGICGISTIFWGAIFGGWFGVEAEILQQSAVGSFLLKIRQIDPLDGQQTLVMFGLALALGVVHMGVGYFLSFLNKRRTSLLDGIFNDLSWVTIFVGGLLVAAGMVFSVKVLQTVGLVIAAIGVVMLVVGGCLGKKNVFKMVGGIFGNLYGSINIFSDILSYARLFGLGLTTGVIGLAINKIGYILIDMLGPVGYIAAVIVWVGGHIFNFGINTLGVYVHNSRLQYVEFFGKFHTEGGRIFAPLGSKTRFVYLKDSLELAPAKKVSADSAK